MRELNSREITSVSGAGLLADIAGSIGTSLGNEINHLAAVFGINIDVSTATSELLYGVGSILELNVSGAVENLSSGIADLVDATTTAIERAKSGSAVTTALW